MARAVALVVALVLVFVIVFSVLAGAQIVSGTLWISVVVPLLVGGVGFLITFLLAVSGQVTEGNVKSIVTFVWGAVTGLTVARVTDWWNAIRKFIDNPSTDPATFVVGSSAFFLLVGIGTGLYLGLRAKSNLANVLDAAGQATKASVLRSGQRIAVLVDASIGQIFSSFRQLLY